MANLTCGHPSVFQLATPDPPRIRALQYRHLAFQAVTARRAVCIQFRKNSISAAVAHARRPRPTLPPQSNAPHSPLPRPSRFCRAHLHVVQWPRIKAATPTLSTRALRRRRAAPTDRPRPRLLNAKVAIWPIRKIPAFPPPLPLLSRYLHDCIACLKRRM
jgi:hypothetical protein